MCTSRAIGAISSAFALLVKPVAMGSGGGSLLAPLGDRSGRKLLLVSRRAPGEDVRVAFAGHTNEMALLRLCQAEHPVYSARQPNGIT